MTAPRSRQIRYAIGATLIVAMLTAACGGQPAARAEPTTPPPSAPGQASGSPVSNPSLLSVPATANIFGAGHERMPQPGAGGGGSKPPSFQLPAGSDRVVRFEDVSGTVIPVADWGIENGPDGTGTGHTDIISTGGISGVVHDSNQMFLVGVFLTDAEPADPAPERLDFTANEDFEELAPEIAQVFLIGDGVGRRYAVPDDATRLFLGFADAGQFVGEVGYYGNNSGNVEARVIAE